MIYVDALLRSVGFPQGLESAKEVALELLEDSNQGNTVEDQTNDHRKIA